MLIQTQNSTQASTQLQALAKQRRLLAASDESKMLQPVDPATARQLMVEGGDVFVLSGHTQDQLHNRRISASNSTETTGHVRDEAYVERTFSYDLLDLNSPADLQQVKPGEGLPPGLAGVLRDARSCSKVISADSQVGDVRITSNSSSLNFAQSGFSGDPNVNLDARRVHGGIVRSTNVRDVIMLGGALAGIMTAMSMGAPPVGALGGLLAGGIVGRELGIIAQRKMPAREIRSF